MSQVSDAARRIAEARKLFPGAMAAPYLNVASRGILSTESRGAALANVEEQVTGDGTKEAWQSMLDGARAGFATLIGAAPAEVAVTKNVSEGINIVANAIDWRRGDNVVLCPELEHPNNVFIWQLLEKRGVEMRAVKARDNDIDVEAMIGRIDDRTRLLTASSVTFTPGFRTDIDILGAACRARGAFFLVDAVQSAGVLAIDVARSNIDGLAVSSSKGLLGLIGLGFLYVRKEWIERLEPAYIARFSVDLGGAHESEGASAGPVKFLADARRFEVGNFNWSALAAMDVSLRRLNAIGPRAIEEHAVGLAERLRQGLVQRGFAVSPTPKGRKPSHIVTVGALGSGGAYSTADDRLNRLAQSLKDAGAHFSIRRGQVRFGTHVYNSAEDIERVLEVATAVS